VADNGPVLSLRQRIPVAQRVDCSALTPERLAGSSVAQVERLPLRLGRVEVPLAEIFTVAGEAGSTLRFELSQPHFDRIGAALAGGSIEVAGDAGAYAGIGMRAGRLDIEGSAGAFAGCSMSGGSIVVRRDAGDLLGAPLPGEHKGMSGGSIVVLGSAGARAGDHMRRGTIVIDGDAGDYAGARMGGGTLAVLGGCGVRPGYGMRRGTLLFLGEAPRTGATFADCGAHRLGFLALLARDWKALPSRIASLERADCVARRWMGDQGFGGQGELLHWPG